MTASYETRTRGINASVAFKAPCQAATNSNISLSGYQTVDGVVLVEDDRVLVRSQTDASENGIWTVNGSFWERAKDFNNNGDIRKGTMLRVSGGTVYSGSLWVITTANPIVLGTDDIVFSQENSPLVGVSSFIETLLDDNTDEIARATLGLVIGTDVAAPGANSDITSLSGLTTPLSVAQGGTSVATFSSGKILVGAGAGAITTIEPSLYGFTTGDAKLTYKTQADAGWVLADDGSIGNATSGASTRANADTEALFILLWDKISDTYASVSSGRGITGAADFAASKTLSLPKQVGRMLLLYGTGAGLTTRALGETGGSEDAIVVSHTHSDTFAVATGGSHTHAIAYVTGSAGGFNGLVYNTSVATQGSTATGSDGSHAHSLTGSVSSAGSSGTDANMTPWGAINFMIKL